MSQPFIGEIRSFGFNFAPRGWAMCNGQLLSISQNAALFSLLGTIYGGNGTTNFALPDLRGRFGLHLGQGPGLSNYPQGQAGGSESIALTTGQIPAHNHPVNCSSNGGTFTTPVGNVWAPDGTGTAVSYANTANAAMAGNAIGLTGSGQGHENRQPFLVLNICIALNGIFPTRN